MLSTILKNKTRAFSLLEMSIVVFIASLIAGGGLALYDQIRQGDQFKENKRRMDMVESAIINYMRYNAGSLPCPALDTVSFYSADSFGFSQLGATNGTCAAALIPSGTTSIAEGTVPTRTLGIPDAYAFDAWGNRFKYGINMYCSGNYTNVVTELNNVSSIVASTNYSALNNMNLQTGSGTVAATLTNCATAANNYTIKNTSAAGTDIATSIPFILVSYGPNGHGAYNAEGTATRRTDNELGIALGDDEKYNSRLNADGTAFSAGTTAIFKSAIYTRDGTYFDDIVRYKSRQDLLQSAGFILYNPDTTNITRTDPLCDYATSVIRTDHSTGTTTDNSAAICGTTNTNCATQIKRMANMVRLLCTRYTGAAGF